MDYHFSKKQKIAAFIILLAILFISAATFMSLQRLQNKQAFQSASYADESLPNQQCENVVVNINENEPAECPTEGTSRTAQVACDGVNFFEVNDPKCLTLKDWQVRARQICGCIEMMTSPTTTEPTPSITPAVGQECRVLRYSDQWPNTGPDVYRYNSEQECLNSLNNCSKTYPDRNCRALNFGDEEKNYCIANICSFDGISIWESNYSGIGAYTKIRKNNSCPAENFTGCMSGFSCEMTTDGIKATMVDRSRISPGSMGWPWKIGLNCPCHKNEELEGGGGEIFNSNFCESFKWDWIELNALQNGESVVCSFSTLNCVKE